MGDPERPFAQNDGAGYRAVYELGASERSVFIQSSGRSGNPLSSYCEDYAEPWRGGHSLPMLPHREAVQGDALGMLVFWSGSKGTTPTDQLRNAR